MVHFVSRPGSTAALLAVFAVVVVFAQPDERPALAHDERNPNFDIRWMHLDPRGPNVPDAPEYLARFAPALTAARALDAARSTAVARLRDEIQGVLVEPHFAIQATEIVSAMPGTPFLTEGGPDRVGTLRAFLTAHAAVYGIAAAEVSTLEVVADYMNPSGNMGWAELEQRFNGLSVFQGTLRGGFTAKGELVRTTGLLATGIDPATLATTPILNAADAVAMSAATVGWEVNAATLVEAPTDAATDRTVFASGALANESSAWLTYFPLAPGVARLAWATEILGEVDGFLTLVDAKTGTMLFRKNLTSYQTQPATYNVYGSDSPTPHSPSTALPGQNFQPPAVARETYTLIGNEGAKSYNNLGWMTDGANGVNGHTDGNNVEAGMDLVAPDGIESTAPCVNRVCSAEYDPINLTPAHPDYRRGEAINLFFWSNFFHDTMYSFGFTEQARNFQHNNFSRGGAGNDRIRAEGQDYTLFNVNNFFSPTDGNRGRLQMGIFNGSDPDRSAGLDQELVLHELAHGVSSRLHSNGAGLAVTQPRGMAEGWSDVLAMSILSTSDDINGWRGFGAYSARSIEAEVTDNYYYGLRRFPYAELSVTGGPLNRPHNPVTFADIDSAQKDLTNGAYPPSALPSTFADDPHNVGEVWGSALWEFRGLLIGRHGHDGGISRFLQYTTDAMKLDPVNPTLLQGRDALLAAILAADANDHGMAWQAFARRGMGVYASTPNPLTTTVVENFTAPGDPLPTFSINNASAVESNTGTMAATFTITLANPTSAASRISFATANGTATDDFTTSTFTSSGVIAIPQLGSASPYPATVNVSGIPYAPSSIAIRINNLAHQFTQDVGLMLQGPGGQAMVIQGNVGVGSTGAPVTYTWDDDGAQIQPFVPIVPGTYRPHSGGPTVFFAPPAPSNPAHAAPGGTATLREMFLANIVGGLWRLFVTDDSAGDAGTIESFSMVFGHSGAAADYVATRGEVVFGPGITSRTVSVTIPSDTNPEANKTFVVNLLAPTIGVIGDGQGIGTIIDDDSGPRAPTAVDDSYRVVAGGFIGGGLSVLLNDSDNGGGPMTAVLATNVRHGELNLEANGEFIYISDRSFVGTDTFTYRAVNSVGESNVATVTITVTPNRPLQPPTGLRVDAVTGQVRLVFTPPTDGPPATGYELAGGLLPSQTLAVLPTGSTNPVFEFDAPGSGSYWIRMHTIAGGERSGPSNEVPLHINTTVTPSAPVNLLGLANGSQLALAWTNTFLGGVPTSTIVNVTGALTTSVGVPPGETFAFPSVPNGTYTFTVSAANAGGSSAPSNPVTLTFPGECSSPPQTPLEFYLEARGGRLSGFWSTPQFGSAPTGYQVNVISQIFTGTLSVPQRSISATVPPGSYTLSVAATNACGTSAPTAPATVVVQ